jgi:hypothetical protein
MKAVLVSAAMCLATTACLAHDQSRPRTASRASASSARPDNVRRAPASPRRSPTPPASCTGSDDLRLESVYIESDDVGVTVVGNCDIIIIDSEINAGTNALVIQGNGSIEIHDSLIQGGRAAFEIQGNGDVRATNSRFVGGQTITGNGAFVDGGGNLWE